MRLLFIEHNEPSEPKGLGKPSSTPYQEAIKAKILFHLKAGLGLQ